MRVDKGVQRALDKWGEVAILYSLPVGMVRAVSKKMSQVAVRQLIREVPEAVEALKGAGPGTEGQQAYEELMAKLNVTVST